MLRRCVLASAHACPPATLRGVRESFLDSIATARGNQERADYETHLVWVFFLCLFLVIPGRAVSLCAQVPE